MANHTSRNGNNKRNNFIHVKHLLSVPGIGGGNKKIISYPFSLFYDYFLAKSDQSYTGKFGPTFLVISNIKK